MVKEFDRIESTPSVHDGQIWESDLDIVNVLEVRLDSIRESLFTILLFEALVLAGPFEFWLLVLG
jgi:hypothetical protein